MDEEKLKRSAAELLGPLIKKVSKQSADNELEYARAKLKKAIERLFEYEVARIGQLIEEPARYSVKEWERVMTEFECIARRFLGLRERMEEARPLTMIDDTEPKGRPYCGPGAASPN
jgi:hypothetical protein